MENPESKIPATFTRSPGLALQNITDGPLDALKVPLALPIPENPSQAPRPASKEKSEKSEIYQPVDFESGNIEDFLANHGPLFGMVEYGWLEVDDKANNLRKLAKGGLCLFEDPTTGKITAQRPVGSVVKAVKKGMQHNAAALPPIWIRKIRNRVSHEDIAKTAQFLSKEARSEAAFKDWADIAWQRRDQDDVRTRVTHTEEEILDGLHDLLKAYTYAFGSQHLAVNSLTAMLEDDANVVPFVDRLQEIISMRNQGIDEYTGLLEVVNVLISQQQAEQGASSLERAIFRVADKVFTPEDFVQRMLFTETPSVHGQVPKDFLASVAGAKMVAETVMLMSDSGLDQQKLVSEIASRLKTLTNGSEWQSAYETDTKAQANRIWRSLLRDIQKYGRRGRLPEGGASNEVQEPQKRSKSRRSTPRSLSDSDIEDIRSSLSTPVVSPALGIMKSVQGSDKFFTSEQLTLDEIMEHSLTAKFLDDHPGIANLDHTLRKYIENLSSFPTNPFTTKTISKWRFSVEASGVPPQAKYPMRRFRADVIANEGTTFDPLNRRVRILYGLVPGPERSSLLINSIVLRDGDTYQ